MYRLPVTIAAAVLLVGASPIAAQDSTNVRGLTLPAQLRAARVQADSMVRIVNSITVLADTMIGPSDMEVRVVSTWGRFARLDCDCLTTILYVGLNDSGETLRAYRVPELLDPKVDSITTESDQPVIYVTDGLRSSLRHARIVATLSGISITEASKR